MKTRIYATPAVKGLNDLSASSADTCMWCFRDDEILDSLYSMKQYGVYVPCLVDFTINL